VQASVTRMLAAAVACLLAALALLAPAASAKCAFRFDQCGGRDWRGARCCVKYNECVRKNRWYSQCLPTKPPDGIVAWFGQCGGKDWTGDTKCEPFSMCVGDDFYKSCRPDEKYRHGTE
jgi:Fungal cellulose binding domain